MIGAGRTIDSEELRTLLEAALKLLSSYAEELNAKDGGSRKTYNNIEIWKRDASS